MEPKSAYSGKHAWRCLQEHTVIYYFINNESPPNTRGEWANHINMKHVAMLHVRLTLKWHGASVIIIIIERIIYSLENIGVFFFIMSAGD